MKKLLSLLVGLMIICTVQASAADVTVNLPAFDVTFNAAEVDSSYRQFPLIVYRDITYVPMTYFDCRYLGLATDWDSDTKTLSIEKTNVTCAYRDYNWQWENPRNDQVTVCDFNIRVNGKAVNNQNEEYPLLTYRDVTYFPLTWRFAVDEFGWEYSFDAESGLSIRSDTVELREIELPNLAGSVATDGKFYYYNGDDGDKHVVYRVPVEDTKNPEIIFEHPDSGMSRRVSFVESEGDIYFYYTLGTTPVMSTRYVKKINPDGTLSDEKPSYYTYSAHGYSEVYVRGNGIEVMAVNPYIQSATQFSYTINGVTTEVEPYSEPIDLGERRDEKVTYSSYIHEDIRIHGDKIYFAGKNVVNSEDSDLFVIDTKTAKIEKLIDSVCGFYVYTGWDNEAECDTTMIIYDNNGRLMRYKESTGTSDEIEDTGVEGLILLSGAGDSAVSTVQRTLDGRKTVVKHFDCYGIGSIKETVYETNTGTEYLTSGEYLLVYTWGELPEDNVRMVIPHKFYSADTPESVFIYEDTLIYKISGENKVIQVDLMN